VDGSILHVRMPVPLALDPNFMPAALANRRYRAAVQASGGTRVGIALERENGCVYRGDVDVLPPGRHDGDVTALAGALSLNVTSILGVAMGSSEAAGYLDRAGRITSGQGGEVLFARAQATLREMFPRLAERVTLHVPDERSRRVGQAVAAASLPVLTGA
jgi:hypothetical protein